MKNIKLSLDFVNALTKYFNPFTEFYEVLHDLWYMIENPENHSTLTFFLITKGLDLMSQHFIDMSEDFLQRYPHLTEEYKKYSEFLVDLSIKLSFVSQQNYDEQSKNKFN